MRKVSIILLLVFLAVFCVGCNSNKGPQAKAEKFLNAYYSQYEKKDEIEEIFESGDLNGTDSDELVIVSDGVQEQKIKDFIDRNFKDMLTERGRDLLVSNRLIPKADVLDSDIVKATIVKVEFDTSEDDNENLSFSLDIDYEHEDGSNTNSSEKGWIRVIDEEGTLKVDGLGFN
ncbi:MAG: hypothetical protein GX080_06490 [Tissierellia bacterium]|nr:hypothetical protein [Tissierellia bacterium]